MTWYRTGDTHYGRDYWDTYDSGRGYTDSTLWEDIAHIVKELFGYDSETGDDVSSTKNVLDLGCAMGYLVRHLRRRGFDAWGLDISSYAVEEKSDADVRDWLRVWDMSTTDTPYFGWEAHDIVICLETLEHIEPGNCDAALRNLRNLLRPGGQALLAICVKENEGWESDPTHVNVQPRDWWIPKLEGHGLTIIPEGEDAIREYAYWRDHSGIFVVERPLAQDLDEEEVI